MHLLLVLASIILDFKNTSYQLKEYIVNIAELQKRRNREEQKIKLENLITELSSLNSTLMRKVKCLDCGSNTIIFSMKILNLKLVIIMLKKL